MRNRTAKRFTTDRPESPASAIVEKTNINEARHDVIAISPGDIFDLFKKLFGGPRPTDEEVKVNRIRDLEEKIEKLRRRNDEIQGKIDKLDQQIQKLPNGSQKTEKEDDKKALEREKATNDKEIRDAEAEKKQAQGSAYPTK